LRSKQSQADVGIASGLRFKIKESPRNDHIRASSRERLRIIPPHPANIFSPASSRADILSIATFAANAFQGGR
jgi:hypothetical protein